MPETPIKLIECPRDAMQGIKEFIPTDLKVAYINRLLKCGFDTLDMGSFVSSSSIPQLIDTAQVLDKIEANNNTKLLTIVANKRGVEEAIQHDSISYLGYPFSISETFQKRNINKGIDESMRVLHQVYDLAASRGKEVVLYLSMGFGNPYGDHWSEELVEEWVEKLQSTYTSSIIAISDTIGCANPIQVKNLFANLNKSFPKLELGAHLHVLPSNVDLLAAAAFDGGCRRFDSVIKGYGGCPMAKDELTGNMPTELLLKWMATQKVANGIDQAAFKDALHFSEVVFSKL